MKVIIVKDDCIGCGACQGISPDIFELNDKGFAEVKTSTVSEEKKEEVLDAIESCPTDAIKIEDKEK